MGSFKKFGALSSGILILCVGACFPVLTSAEITCPAKTLISPCECYFVNSFNMTYVTCTYSLVTQNVLNNLIAQLRKANNLTKPEDVLDFGVLEVKSFSAIPVLDLTPFLVNRLKVERFEFSSSNNVTAITGPPLNATDGSWTPIEAGYVKLSHFRVNDEGFGETLKYFNSSVMWGLDISGSDLEGQPGPELIPGLSALTELSNLDLSANKLKEISGAPFRKMTKMQNLNIAYLIRTEQPLKLGDNAFLINAGETSSININLHANRFKDEDFINQDLGLLNSNREILLGLGVNNFRFLSQENFEPFLEANRRNEITLEENDLICDERMSWLKNKTSEYESRIYYAKCANDNGQAIWDSNLIP